jgi:anti-anti-sigma factor
MSAARSFERSFDALQGIFDFTAAQFALQGIPDELRPTVDLVLEELFTNMVKYGRGGDGAVRIEVSAAGAGVEVTMVDYGAARFDVTQAPDVDTGVPIEQRNPGGLGLHLVKRLVDSIEYQYREEGRESLIRFKKTLARPEARPAKEERETKMLAIDFGAEGVVVITGRLDAAQCPTAQSFLDKVQGTVTMDCSRLEYISSAGLGVLLKTQKRLMAGSGKLRLSGINRHLQDIFQYSGFDQIFEIEPAR